MKYIKLYENWNFLKEDYEEDYENEEDEYEEIDKEEIFKQALDAVNWGDYPWMDRKNYYVSDDTYEDDTIEYGIMEIVLDADFDPNFNTGDSMPHIAAEGYYIDLIQIDSIFIDESCKDPQKFFDKRSFDETYVETFSCENNSEVGNWICDTIEGMNNQGIFKSYTLTGCENVTRFSLRSEIFGTGSFTDLDISENNIIWLDKMPSIVNGVIDVRGNCLVSLGDLEKYKKGLIGGVHLDDNPWLEDPKTDGYVWDKEECIKLFLNRLDEGRIDLDELKAVLKEKNKIHLLGYVPIKLDDETARIVWEFATKYDPDNLMELYNNFKEVGNKIPPDFLARMKRYDHSEYRDSKLDSEWKEIF